MITISKELVHETVERKTRNEQGDWVTHYKLISKDPKTGKIKKKQRFTNYEQGGLNLPIIERFMCMFIDVVRSSNETIWLSQEYINDVYKKLLETDIFFHSAESLKYMYLLLQEHYPSIYEWAKKEEEKMNQLEQHLMFSNMDYRNKAYHISFKIPDLPHVTLYGMFDVKTKRFRGKGAGTLVKNHKEYRFRIVLLEKVLQNEETQGKLKKYMKNHPSVRLQLMMI